MSETSAGGVLAELGRAKVPVKTKRATEPVKEGKAKEIPKATHEGILLLAGHKLECAVLDDGRRILKQSSIGAALGRTSGSKTMGGGRNSGDTLKTPYFLVATNLKPFLDKNLTRHSRTPIRYTPLGGGVAYGYEATMLPEACGVFIDAYNAGVLHPKQYRIFMACTLITKALSKVGIVALVDDVTGYQDLRAQGDLQKLLQQYVSRELARWVHTFPPEFYRQIYRLKMWPFDPTSSTRCSAIAQLTVDIVYDRIHPDLLYELKRVRKEGKQLNTKLHQWLTTTPNGGHPRLREHLGEVTLLMKVSANWAQFQKLLDQHYPKRRISEWES